MTNLLEGLRFFRAYDEEPHLVIRFDNGLGKGYLTDAKTNERLLEDCVSELAIFDRQDRENPEIPEELLAETDAKKRYLVFVRS